MTRSYIELQMQFCCTIDCRASEWSRHRSRALEHDKDVGPALVRAQRATLMSVADSTMHDTGFNH